MTTPFRIRGLPSERFAHLFAMTPDELKRHGAVRMVTDDPAPCRISLTDAAPDDTVWLVNYEHQPAGSPYRSRYAVFVREGETTFDAVGQIPEQLRTRVLSLRAFDAHGMVTATELVDGRAVEGAIETLLADPRAETIHIHYAKPGCYAAKVERA